MVQVVTNSIWNQKAKNLLDSISGKPLSRSQRQEYAIQLASFLMEEANETTTQRELAQQAQLASMMQDPYGKAFTMSLTDQGFRSQNPKRVANQINHLLDRFGVPNYLNSWKRFELSAFRKLSGIASPILVPLATQALRKETATVILPGEEDKMTHHMHLRRQQGVRLNLNHLGEAILGEEEAQHRLQVYLDDLRRDDIEYISIKISTIFSQIHLIGWEETLHQLKSRLRQLYQVCMKYKFTKADGTQVPKFVNLDMEEYRDLALTKELFQAVLDEPEFFSFSAGLVLQAYLPDSFSIQKELTHWAMKRVSEGGAPIKIRIVKGANVAMEKVEASLRNWPQAPFQEKVDVDANFKRMIEYAFNKEHAHAVHIGVGSHNLFDIAYAMLLQKEQLLEKEISFEMLEGMAEPMRRVVQSHTGSILLYCPVAKNEDFQSAIAYLIRRLDENTGPENFLRHSFGLQPGTPAWNEQASLFRKACMKIDTLQQTPRRTQDRFMNEQGNHFLSPFENESDTDFSLPQNRKWAQQLMTTWKEKMIPPIPLVIAGQEISQTPPQGQGEDPSFPGKPLYHYSLASEEQIDQALQTAKHQEAIWGTTSVAERTQRLAQVAQILRERRADLCGAMMADGGKTLLESDPEVSEAIDFAEYYRRNLLDLHSFSDLKWTPKGTVLITPPWNFPISIPAGGILAALAGGNCVLFKPAPETVLCGWVLVNAFWDAGIPKEVLQFINCVDDPVGSKLIADPRLSAIILTGATSTARLFKRLNPKVELFAETGGKNAMIITALSDRDSAIKDLIHSAFGHAGQKCSATSLAILEAEVYDDPHFLRQLTDAVQSMRVTIAWDPSTKINPLIRAPGEDLRRGLTLLEEGEEWLVEPKVDSKNPNLWSPGIKKGVRAGSFTHQTELFGPVLGLMRAENLQHAIQLANGTPYGLTSGLQSLDDREQKMWSQSILAGNCYINRTTTGAIVNRQPFGGCKASSFGKGAKAGGPNYVAQLMNVHQVGIPTDLAPGIPLPAKLRSKIKLSLPSTEEKTLFEQSLQSYSYFANQFSKPEDLSQILGQDNFFLYRPQPQVVYRIQLHDSPLDLFRTWVAALCVGNDLEVSYTPGQTPFPIEDDLIQELPLFRFHPESASQFYIRVKNGEFSRIRLLSEIPEPLYQAATDSATTLLHSPVLQNGRFELLSYLREVSLSIDYHRYGNLGTREHEKRKPIQ